MENKEKIKLNGQEKPIKKIELVFNHLGTPGASFGISINGEADYAFHLGFGKLLENIPPEKLCEIFPYAFRMTEVDGKKKFVSARDGLFKIWEDRSGLQQLANILDVPIDMVKEDIDFKGGQRQREDRVERYTVAPLSK